ncbi:hypothetical protein [Fluviispira sanaruensis]|uniref:Lipocalin-like domain-containing protein n=1 Tax=Fluviispira sanaruensis TaxID=2493639 RepID=A0A4P2VLH9_FLUSA|nr:hypothetical protein [Fluviispira sanaruensis]BBH52640.1 hypothetical protein JCM31447_10810 [Fluviispira sanaruensis]
MLKKIILLAFVSISGSSFANNLAEGIWQTEFVSSIHGRPVVEIKKDSVDLYIDNRCRFNQVGDPGICTMNLIIPTTTTLDYLYSSHDGAKKVYNLKGTKFSIVETKGIPTRLIVEENGFIKYSLPVKKSSSVYSY